MMGIKPRNREERRAAAKEARRMETLRRHKITTAYGTMFACFFTRQPRR